MIRIVVRQLRGNWCVRGKFHGRVDVLQCNGSGCDWHRCGRRDVMRARQLSV